MTPAAIIHEAVSRGVTLRVEGTDLDNYGRRGALRRSSTALRVISQQLISELMG